MPDDIAILKTIEAPLIFLAADSEPPFVYTHEAPPGMPQRGGTFETHVVAISDGRPLAAHLSLDREGFMLRHHDSKVRDFYDSDEVRRVYYPEIEALVKELTGAAEIVIFDHTVRNTATGEAGKTIREPAATLHNDYTEKSAPQRVRDLLPSGEAEARLQRRYVEINVWRPVVGPVEAWPLALGDAQTLESSDLVVSERRYPDRTGETYAVKYSPRQRWLYFPRMRRDEVIVLKCFDSLKDGRARLSVHSAFQDPTTPADAPPRESIEVRTFAFF
jgi:hypothetical protein